MLKVRLLAQLFVYLQLPPRRCAALPPDCSQRGRRMNLGSQVAALAFQLSTLSGKDAGALWLCVALKGADGDRGAARSD